MEALEVIFPDELTITQRKPYKFQIQINSNSDEAENHLKMLLKVELGYEYPAKQPDLMILKNLSPDYLENTMLDQYEIQIQQMAREMLGEQMMFNLCDHLREQISEINDTVVDKFNKIMEQRAEEEAIAKGPQITNNTDLNYTPVNKETFGKWCEVFLAKLQEEDEAN